MDIHLITPITCCDCGTEFAVTNTYFEFLNNTSKAFSCPNGHGNVFRKKDSADYKKISESLASQLATTKARIKELEVELEL